MAKANRVPVTVRALLQRINRKSDVRVFKARDAAASGEYYSVSNGAVSETHLSLEAFGRKVGALKPWEKLDG